MEPPPEWSAKSKPIPSEQMLEMVVTQNCESLPYGCFDVSIGESMELDFASYKTKVESESSKINGMSDGQIEDVFWAEIAKDSVYSLNNNFSLFGDTVKIWNLNQFTKDQSIIHTKENLKVRKVSI